MPPRLLSLLCLIETSLSASMEFECGAVVRSVDYRKGIARMTFAGAGSIVVQNFQLADGQLCIRVDLRRAGAVKPVETSIYPQATVFDWAEAATRVAREWNQLAPVEAEAAATISA